MKGRDHFLIFVCLLLLKKLLFEANEKREIYFKTVI